MEIKNEDKIPVGGFLDPTTPEKVLGSTESILDENTGKRQSEINAHILEFYDLELLLWGQIDFYPSDGVEIPAYKYVVDFSKVTDIRLYSKRTGYYFKYEEKILLFNLGKDYDAKIAIQLNHECIVADLPSNKIISIVETEINPYEQILLFRASGDLKNISGLLADKYFDLKINKVKKETEETSLHKTDLVESLGHDSTKIISQAELTKRFDFDNLELVTWGDIDFYMGNGSDFPVSSIVVDFSKVTNIRLISKIGNTYFIYKGKQLLFKLGEDYDAKIDIRPNYDIIVADLEQNKIIKIQDQDFSSDTQILLFRCKDLKEMPPVGLLADKYLDSKINKSKKEVEDKLDDKLGVRAFVGEDFNPIRHFISVIPNHTYALNILTPWSYGKQGDGVMLIVYTSNNKHEELKELVVVGAGNTTESLYSFTVPKDCTLVECFFRAQMHDKIFYSLVDVTYAETAGVSFKFLQNNIMAWMNKNEKPIITIDRWYFKVDLSKVSVITFFESSCPKIRLIFNGVQVLTKGVHYQENLLVSANSQNLVLDTSKPSIEVIDWNAFDKKKHVLLLTAHDVGENTPKYGLWKDFVKYEEEEVVPKIIEDIKYYNVDEDACAVSAITKNKYGLTDQYRYLQFLITADVHNDWVRFNRALDYAKKNPNVAATLCLGDFVDVPKQPIMDKGYDLTSEVKKYGKPFLSIIGNHEKCGSDKVTDEQLYQFFFNDELQKLNGEIHEANKHSLYWYKDFVKPYKDYDENYQPVTRTRKMRIIGLNAYEAKASSYFRSITPYFKQEQIIWFAETLESVEPDMDVIILMHVSPSANTTKIEGSWTPTDISYDNRFQFQYMSDNTILSDIVDAWIHGKNITRTFDSEIVNDEGTINESNKGITINKTFTAHPNQFVCWLAAHVHHDYLVHVTEHPEQKVVLFNCTTAKNNQQEGDIGRSMQGKSQDSVTLFSYDWDKKAIKLVRLGANTTIDGRSRKYVVINK